MFRRMLPALGVLIAPLALLVGIWAGGHPDSLPGFLRESLVDERDGRLYEDAVDVISRDFYRPVDRDKLFDSALEAAVRSLDDRFSHYFDPKTFKEFSEITSGEFEGVGMTVDEIERGLKVITVFDGSPAEKAGIRPGDIVVAVNGRSLRGRSSDEAVARIKGKAGTTVRLTIRTRGRQRVEVVERAAVNVPVVEAKLVSHEGERYAHVALESFTSGSHGEVRKAVEALLKKDAQGIVLDLRDNGGGLLQEAVLLASVFIGDGTIVTTKGRTRKAQTYEAIGRPIASDIPVAVLVNENSASASEIVAGAIQDRDRGEIVGSRTFGKGVFQEIQELPNGGALDITVGEYFTPKGRNLGPVKGKKAGITPDVPARDRTKTKRDEALEAALEVLVR